MQGFFKSSELKTKKQYVPKIPQCGKCGLSKNCISPKMKPQGKGNHKILFVGDCPGEKDDRQGKVFMELGGKILRKTLFEMRMNLNNCLSTNAVICKPKKLRVEPYMISSCRANLLKTIKKFKPNVIITLGKEALESILYFEQKKSIGELSKWTGWHIPSKSLNAWICPVEGLAQVMKSKKHNDNLFVNIFKKQVKKAIKFENRKVNYISLNDLKSKIDVVTDKLKAKRLLKTLSKKKGLLAFDYETTGLKPDKKNQEIVSISFCLNGKKTFACMVDEDNKPIISKILRSPHLKKIASNMQFEERWTMAIFGHGVENWIWDTMLASHLLDNRSGINSIKFQSFVHFGIPDYDSHIKPYLYSKTSNGKNRIHEIDEEELLMYNGLDSLLEYLVAKRQREFFGKEKR